MSRLRHEKARQHAGAGSGVHRLEVGKPRPFKPIEERKHGGETHDVHGKAHHHKLGRKRGGSVKKKSDGGNVTTVGKTNSSNPPADKSLSGPFNRAKELQGPLDQIGTWGVRPSYEWHDEALKSGPKAQDSLGRAKGGHVGHRDVDTPDRGTKYGTPVQDVPMAGTESGYGGKFAHGKGHVEDSLRRGGHAHHADGEKVDWLHKKHGGKLTYQERKHLKSSSFVFPGERRYPINDESHARNALARVSQHGSSGEKAKVRAAVHRKYPGIGKD